MSSSVSNTGSTSADPIVSMTSAGAGTSASGGSVINVSELVSELVSAAQAPQESLITSQTEAVTSEISAVGTLQSALSTFQQSLSALDSASAFNAMTASSSDSSSVDATAAAGATSGTYTVAVSNLAQAQQLLSNAFSSGATTAIGTGTLSVSLGGSSFNVTINSSDDTLNGIAAAINSASGNPGITATVLQGSAGSGSNASSGAYLLLASSLTGAANTIAVTETDGGSALSALTYGSGNTGNYMVQTPAEDASYSIDGVTTTSSSNTVSGAIKGVTLDLVNSTGSDGVTIAVAADPATIESNVQSFVTAYNTLLGVFQSLGGYDASTQTAGTLMGNSMLEGVQNQTSQALYSIVNTGSSVYNTLASVGVTTNSDGTLSLNTTTLSNALASNQSAVSTLFSGSSGVATTLNNEITADLSTSGSLGQLSQSLTSQENSLTQQSDALTTRMSALSASLTQQYAALNTMLSSLETTSSYLTQAFDDLPKVQSSQSA